MPGERVYAGEDADTETMSWELPEQVTPIQSDLGNLIKFHKHREASSKVLFFWVPSEMVPQTHTTPGQLVKVNTLT